MISLSRVLSAADKIIFELEILTFDGNDQLGDNSNNLSSTLVQELIGTHDGQESVGVHFFSKTIKEDWEIVEIVELSRLHREGDSVH